MQDFSFAQEIFEFPGKLQHRLPRRKILHPHALPVGRRVDAGAERLGESLLGGEALGEVGGGQAVVLESAEFGFGDRKSTRLNSSHLVISYAVFCLKKKKNARYGVTVYGLAQQAK